jgi:hypothetical protein
VSVGHEDPNWTPRPDPTLLTTQQLLRELSSLREIFETRLNAMDKATIVLSETVNRTPTAIQTAVGNLEALVNEKFEAISAVSVERFGSIGRKFDDADIRYQQHFRDRDIRFEGQFGGIQKQFEERDIRTEQAATASAQALAAALQAAKEAVFEQAQAAAKAAEKTELSFTKQIDQIQLQIKTIGDGFSDRIAELKERIDRGEGAGVGRTESTADERYQLAHQQDVLNQRMVVSAVVISVVVIVVNIIIALIIHK